MNNPTTSQRPDQPRSLVKAISLTFAGQGGMLVLSTIISIVVARLLGPSGKGELATAIIIAGILGLLSELGLRASVIRMVASGRATWKEGLATMLALYGALSAVLLPLAISLLWVFHDHFFSGVPISVLMIALFGVPIGLLEGALTCTLIGNQRMPEVSAVWMLEKLGTLFGIIVFVWLLEFGVVGGIVSQVFGVLIGILATWTLLLRLPGGAFRIRMDLLPELVKFGRLWYARNLATSLNYRLDGLIAFCFLGSFYAGLYAVAVSVAELLQQIPSSIDAVLFPNISTGQQQRVEQRTARLSRFTVFVSLVGAAVLAIIGYPLLGIFGRDFPQGYPALLCLLPGMVVLGQSKVIFSEMLGRGEGRYPAIASWVALGATVVLDFVFIPWLGIIGAAIASSIAYSISGILGLRFYKDMTGVNARTLYLVRLDEVVEILRRVVIMLHRRRVQA